MKLSAWNSRTSRLLLGCSAAALLVAGGAHAQNTAPAGTNSGSTAPSDDQGQGASTPGDTIVVTGVRASLRSAQNIKRNAPQIVDSIVAEDIGKLPDKNIAEALQRVTGIQIQRNYGEGSIIAIRGLTQVRTELNGRDIFTALTTPGTANAFSLEDIPSELLAGIDVYKNPSSDLIEDQLSGTINFRTRKPFDFDGFKVSASAGNTYFDLYKKSEPSFSGLISDRWDTGIGEIGILVDVAYQKTNFRQDSVASLPFYTLDQSLNAAGQPNNPTDTAIAATLGRTGQVTTIPHGAGIGEVLGDRRRFGTDVSLQWKPSPTLELTGEVFRNDYKFRFGDYSYFAYTGDAPIFPQPGAPFTFGSNGDFESGTFQNVPINSNTSLEERHSRTTDYSLNVKWTPTSHLTVTADGQYVRAVTHDTRAIVILDATAPTMYESFNGSGLPTVNIGAPGFASNPANYTNGALLDDLNRVKGSDKSGRVDAEYKFDGGLLSSIKVGARYSDRSSSLIDTGYRYTGISSPLTHYQVTDLSDIFRGDGDFPDSVVSFPRPDILDYAQTRADLGVTTLPTYLPSGSNSESQKTYAGYITANFKFDDLPVPIDGNIGVRVVHTKEAVSGFYQQTSQITLPDGTLTNGATTFDPIAFGRSYTNALPSLNLRGHLTDKLQLRLALSENLSRPSFDQLNPSLSLVEPGTSQVNEVHTAVGGNPELKPMKSKNADVSLEWYFSKNGFISIDGFYKRIQNYIQTDISERPVTFDDGKTYTYDVTSYGNISHGQVKGFEVDYQQFFDFLPGLLSGLGLQANFTYVDSKAPSPATSGPVSQVPLELLSKYSYNVVGIYEKGPISARVAYNWRSKYLLTTTGNGSGTLPIFNRALGDLDASITYNVTPHFSLTVDGVNLTDTQTTSYYGLTSRPQSFYRNDRRISGTARITF